ncbi:MAG: MFS transporter [Chthoniobacteraceae bacterium]|nr:MFS transporter [Chthoniobacteraceae bacterium]
MSENASTTAPEPSGLRSMVRAFRHRNFRLFFGGQCISLVGTWIQGVAMSWTVYQLTNSPFLMGLVGFAGQLPIFLLTPLAGVFVDRHSRHRMLLFTQSLSMVQACLLAILAYTHLLNIWGLVTLNALGGIILALDMPTRQSFVVDMVGHGPDLPNAVALNSFTFNGSRILGPAVAGLLLVVFSPAFCFLLNALSYIAVIAALAVMQLPPFARVQKTESRALHELKEGISYVWHFAPIRSILLLIILASLTGASYMVLMPIFAAQVFGGGAHTLGYLMAVPGIGALAAGLYLASRKTVLGAGIRIAAGSAVFGIGLVGLGQSHWMPLAMVFLVLVGLGMIMQMALSNTVIQTLVDDDKRGRVMSLFTVSFVGMAPFGSMLAGSVAERLGAPNTVTLGGCVCIAGALVFALALPSIRKAAAPVYRERGILPATVASGLNNACALSRPPED